jgi:hypothetical protein
MSFEVSNHKHMRETMSSDDVDDDRRIAKKEKHSPELKPTTEQMQAKPQPELSKPWLQQGLASPLLHNTG